MKLYIWKIMQQMNRFDNPNLPYGEFSNAGGYIFSDNLKEAEEKIKKHFDVGFGRIQFTDMKIDINEMKSMIDSEDKITWSFFYGD